MFDILHSRCEDSLEKIFTNCLRILENQTWGRVLEELGAKIEPESLPQLLQSIKSVALPSYLTDLARLEWALYQISKSSIAIPTQAELTINPSLVLLPLSHKNLFELINGDAPESDVETAEDVHGLLWRYPSIDEIRYREADDDDLLALKLVLEEIPVEQAASEGGVSVASIEAILHHGVSQGILLAPPSKIKRHGETAAFATKEFQEFQSANIFTLQYHITQACDLHCKHCYDRRQVTTLPRQQARGVIDDFHEFCQKMRVKGQVTFTGGNPLLYPHFEEIYRLASESGFGLAILGNPSPPYELERLLRIEKPLFFQISLEGLERHNDEIRGEGHFQRSLEFLDTLQQMDIYAMVMLTLTKDNLNQVLPLGELLRDRADLFTFNRLSAVGEGANLLMVDPMEFRHFLMGYQEATTRNPVLALKDNLFNIIRDEQDLELVGGCTGYGCGAAFNFFSLLADGEVHACRKFPSPIGNILENSLTEIYHSARAEKYRNGSSACKECRFNPVCRGCLAVVHSYGLDISKDKDPFCFFSDSTQNS